MKQEQGNSVEKGSAWLKRTWNGKKIDLPGASTFSYSGYISNDALTTNFDPLVVLTLQKFQYPHVFREKSPTDNVEAAVRLLAWAQQHSIEPLKEAISKWLGEARKQAAGRDDGIYVSLLHLPDMPAALQKANLGVIENKAHASCDEVTLLALLKHKASQNKPWDAEASWIQSSIGEWCCNNQAALKALIKFRSEIGERTHIRNIDQYLYDGFKTDLDTALHLPETVQSLLLDSLFDSGKAVRVDVDALDQRKMILEVAQLPLEQIQKINNWFKCKVLTDYFFIRGASNLVKQLLEITGKAEELRQTCLTLDKTPAFSIMQDMCSFRFKDSFSAWISQYIKNIEQLYETPSQRVVGLLTLFVSIEPATQACIEASMQPDESFTNLRNADASAWSLCRKDALLILSLLGREEIVQFMQNNQCDTKKLTFLFNYFIKEAEIAQTCQTLLLYYSREEKKVERVFLLQQELCNRPSYSLSYGVETTQAQDRFLSVLRKTAPTILSKAYSGVDQIKQYPFVDGDYHLFRPELIRLNLLHAMMLNLVYSQIEGRFAALEANQRNALKQFVEQKIHLLKNSSQNSLQNSLSGVELGSITMSKAQAGLLAEILRDSDIQLVQRVTDCYLKLASYLEAYSKSWKW